MTKKYDMCMIGLGPVGAISSACIAKQGFNVIGVDIDQKRVDAFSNNEAPFVEPGVNDLIKEVQNSGKFRATVDFSYAVQNSRIVMIAVGTPTPEESGEPDLSFLDNVSKSIGEALKGIDETGTIVVVRSTVPPGTMRNRMAPIIEKNSGLKADVDFHIASNPEFLREGLAILDFFETSRIVVGANNKEVADKILELYKDVSGERINTTIETGEFAKYVDNTWHAVKVAYANEIGRVVTAFGGDVDETTKIFLCDDKLNISKYYLRPGFAFGGSCLPKDVRGLSHFAGRHDTKIPLVSAIMASNEEQIDQGVKAILASNPKKVGLLGIAFKEDVDDLRESPALYVASKLKAKGIEVIAHDPAYNAGDKIKLPRTDEKLDMVDLEQLVSDAETVTLFHRIDTYLDLLKNISNDDKNIVDLTTVVVTA